MSAEDPIHLAHVAAFQLGRLQVRPPLRQVIRDDGTSEVVEPRVMQVLVALAQAKGGIVTRSELTQSCWEGRVVGEDAINRVMSLLRRLAERMGEGAFRIETITKVGYRLLSTPTEAFVEPGPVASPDAARSFNRRRFALGLGAAGGAAAIGGALWWRMQPPQLSAAARSAMERGEIAFRQGPLDQLTIAAAAFHEAADLAQGAAEPWGKLALTYRWLYWFARGNEAVTNAMRAREAAGKALAIDPDNGDAAAALATLQPEFMNWRAYGAACGTVFARHPDEVAIAMLYVDFLSNVGSIREINAMCRRLLVNNPDWPGLYGGLMLSSWVLGRLDDADAAADQASRRWPRHIGIWFTRQRLLAYTGRAGMALAMIDDIDNRPVGLPQWEYDLARAESQALLTQSARDVDRAAALYWPQARKAVGMAVNAVQFFCAVGRLDDAFAILDALYFDRGFTIGERLYAEEQGVYSPRRNRSTWLFWLPVMAPLRADPRMAAIMRDVELVDYWRHTGNRPDVPLTFPV